MERVAATTVSGFVLRSCSRAAAWMTWVAGRLPATVSTASPGSIGPWRTASSSITVPPFRFMAPATPVPINSFGVSGVDDGIHLGSP